MKKKSIIKSIIIIVLITLLIIIVLPPGGFYIEVYGTVKLRNNTYLMESKYVKCEIDKRVFKLINNTLLHELIDKEVFIIGQLFNDTLQARSVNADYDITAACLISHEEDVVLTPSINYQVTPDEKTGINYDIINNQDQRLFYESTITVDCTVERDYVTGYLNPNEIVLATFELTCPEGEYEASIHTIFIDELGGRHTKDDLITISST